MENITVRDFLNEVKETYSNYFTDSKCDTRLITNLYNSIFINCYLANNKSECINGYFENDMFNVMFTIDTENGAFGKDIDLDSELPSNLKLEAKYKSYYIKPENEYLAYSSRKLNFRKTKGDYKKIINSLDKFFDRLSEELKTDLANDKIHSNHIDLLKEKLI